MVVDTTLTESMLQRLAKIDSRFKEDGDADDPTRLVKSWGGALKEDKEELERLVQDDKLAGKLTASKIKEEYPKYRIYLTSCIQCAIGNYRKKKRKAIEKRSQSKYSFRILCLKR